MRKVTLMNCTPHEIVVRSEDGAVLYSIAPSGNIARADGVRKHVEDLILDMRAGHGKPVPVCRVSYGSLTGLPEPHDGVLYVVSVLAAQAAKAVGRSDVLVVDQAVRDEQGRVIGCRGFARV